MIYILALVGAIGIFMVADSVFGLLHSALVRLKRKSLVEETAPEGGTWLSARIGEKWTRRLAEVGRWLGNPKEDERRLLQAGYPPPFYSLGDFYAIKVILGGILFSTVAALSIIFNMKFLLLLSLPAGVLGLFFPDWLVRKAMASRQEEFKVEMSYKLLLLSIFLQAGLDEVSSFFRIALQKGGQFTRAIALVVKEVQTGIPLKEAMEKRLEEYPFPFFKEMINNVLLARTTGVPLARLFFTQGKIMMDSITSEARGKGGKSLPVMTATAGLFLIAVMAAVLPPILYFVFTQMSF